MNVFPKHHRSSYLVLSVIVLFVYLGSSMCNMATNKDEKNTQEIIYGQNENYIGSRSCISCHKQIYDSYITTAHYKTSAMMDNQSIRQGGNNIESVY